MKQTEIAAQIVTHADSIVRLAGLLVGLEPAVPALSTRPAAPTPARQALPAVELTDGWHKFTISGIYEDETKTGHQKTTLVLVTADLQTVRTSTINEALRKIIANFPRGGSVEAKVERKGQYWNILGIRA
jgi:hypothetical protein